MARTFTITFEHQYQEYMAVVSQLQDSVCIYIPDQHFHHLLPDGRFSFNATEGLHIDPYTQSQVQSLMLDILVALELQIKARQISSV